MIKGIVSQVKTTKSTGDVVMSVDILREQKHEAMDLDKEAVVIIDINVWDKIAKFYEKFCQEGEEL